MYWLLSLRDQRRQAPVSYAVFTLRSDKKQCERVKEFCLQIQTLLNWKRDATIY